jgi:hypothetical protein
MQCGCGAWDAEGVLGWAAPAASVADERVQGNVPRPRTTAPGYWGGRAVYSPGSSGE